MKLLLLLIGFSAFSQEDTTAAGAQKSGDSLKISIDIPSRYLWRGQAFGGNYIAVQPTIEYTFSDKLTIGLWATSNFQNADFNFNGKPKGYQEIDFSVSYNLFGFLDIGVADYYWPSIDKAAGENDNYFNYGKNGVKTVDATASFDFSELEEHAFPLEFMLSTFIAGQDFRINANGEAKQNFTTYAEISFTFENLFKNKILNKTKIKPTIGAVLNNQAEYYEYADYNKVSFVNLGTAISQKWQLCDHLEMPVSLNYIYNGARENVAAGNNYVVAQISLNYK